MVHKNTRQHLQLGVREIIFFVQFLILFFLFLLWVGTSTFQLDPDTLIYLLSVLLLGSFVWSLWSWKTLTHSLFDPYVFFLTAALLFNGGQAILEIFHLNANGILGGRFSSEIVLNSLFLVLMGLMAFHLGAIITAMREKNKLPSPSRCLRNTALSLQSIRIMAWILLLISSIPTLFVLRDAIGVVLSFGYNFGLYGRETVTSFMAAPKVLATFLVPAALFLLAGSKNQVRGRILSAIVIALYVAIQFFLGSRAKAVMPLIAYVWLWHRYIKPLPRFALWIGMGGMLFVVFPLIKAIRNIAGAERLAFSVLIDAYLSIDNPIVAIISEMGISMITVAYTLTFVPTVRPFDMGLGYLYAFFTLIPNLFWDIHPTIAHGLAADWLIQMVATDNVRRGTGYGYSFIAEAYLNFGWIGAFITLALIGFFLAKFVLWAQRSGDPAKMATLASFVAFFLIYTRGESGSIIRSLVWYAFFPYVFVRVLYMLNRKSLNENIMAKTAKNSNWPSITHN